MREGWDKRGARSRLDRRRTMKEAVKRRAVQDDAAAIINDDLRFRQLQRRAMPATNAAVVFALDVSGSMDEAQRRLAKQFFFFALQGIRRQYTKVETLFLAHAAQAWEFDESQFFQASSSGGTVSLERRPRLALEELQTRYDPSRYNAYFFYASGRRERRRGPRGGARRARRARGPAQLRGLRRDRRRRDLPPPRDAARRAVRRAEGQAAIPVGVSHLGSQDDIWRAIREFFTEQAAND